MTIIYSIHTSHIIYRTTGYLCIIDCHLDIFYDNLYIQGEATEVQRTFSICCVTKKFLLELSFCSVLSNVKKSMDIFLWQWITYYTLSVHSGTFVT